MRAQSCNTRVALCNSETNTTTEFQRRVKMNSVLRSRQKTGETSTYFTNRVAFRSSSFSYDPSEEGFRKAQEFVDEHKHARSTEQNRLVAVRGYMDCIKAAHSTPASNHLLDHAPLHDFQFTFRFCISVQSISAQFQVTVKRKKGEREKKERNRNKQNPTHLVKQSNQTLHSLFPQL